MVPLYTRSPISIEPVRPEALVPITIDVATRLASVGLSYPPEPLFGQLVGSIPNKASCSPPPVKASAPLPITILPSNVIFCATRASLPITILPLPPERTFVPRAIPFSCSALAFGPIAIEFVPLAPSLFWLAANSDLTEKYLTLLAARSAVVAIPSTVIGAPSF